MIKGQIILMYHSLFKDGEKARDFYCLPLSKFREQMDYVAWLKQSSECPVALTFDDGDISNYHYAFPILKELGLKAYFFITVSKIGTPGFMNWQQIKELIDSGMSIGSHGMSHNILTGMNDNDLDYELRISKKTLEENLGIPIEYFSIPRGFCNAEIIGMARDNNYKAVFTSDFGVNSQSSFRLRRIPIRNSLSLERFKQILNGERMFKEKADEFFKLLLRWVIGTKNYEKITLKAYND